MKKYFLFKEWLQKTPESLFGFATTQLHVKKPFYTEEPIEKLDSSHVLEELVRMGKLNGRIPTKTWSNILEYGNEPGGLNVSISPLGSYKIIVRKYISDNKGNIIPICKNVIPLLNDFDHKGDNDPSELKLASDIFNVLSKIDQEKLEAPKADWNGLEILTTDLAKRVKMEHPPIMNYGGVIKLNEHTYIIYLTYKGYGNGTPGSQKSEEFIIYMQYKPNKGLIHSWGCEVNSPARTRLYLSAPSEWDELFSPSQPNDEIVNCIMKILSTY
jgi:hypothetical protein